MRTNIKQTIDKAEKEFSSVLVVQNPPQHQYETKEVGFGKKKKRFVMVPEEDYQAMSKQDFFNPNSMKRKVSHLFDELRTAFASLPAIPKLQKKIGELTDWVRYWKTKFEQSKETHEAKERSWQREKTELQADVVHEKSRSKALTMVIQNLRNRFGDKAINEELNKYFSRDDLKQPKRNTPQRDNDDLLDR